MVLGAFWQVHWLPATRGPVDPDKPSSRGLRGGRACHVDQNPFGGGPSKSTALRVTWSNTARF